jgi:hypothetical protein
MNYDGDLMSIQAFLDRNRLGRTSLHYLEVMGRGPAVIRLGGKKLVSPEAEAAWRKAMAETPVKGSLRALALEARAQAAPQSDAPIAA